MRLKLVVICVLHTFIVNTTAEDCFTPNGEKAKCITLFTCPVLIQAIASQNQISIEFVRRSQCGFILEPYVCCGTAVNFTNPTEQKHVNKMDLLPSKQYCGYQHTDDYVRPENDTATSSIDEFPWLVALTYSRANKLKLEVLCAGSLISRRYVLTAAHCVVIPDSVKLAGVRLGEYNIQMREDCVNEGELRECSDPTPNLEIEQVIVHEDYDTNTYINDVALIRLKESVTYSDYVRPICLPFPGTRLANANDTLVQSGWGISLDGQQSKIKKKVTSNLLTRKECLERITSRLFVLTNRQTCNRMKISNENSGCAGDSGGPVMFRNRFQWHQEGIVSFGSKCEPGAVNVNSKVVEYLNWILEKIRP